MQTAEFYINDLNFHAYAVISNMQYQFNSGQYPLLPDEGNSLLSREEQMVCDMATD